jgi:hypothetical protein
MADWVWPLLPVDEYWATATAVIVDNGQICLAIGGSLEAASQVAIPTARS